MMQEFTPIGDDLEELEAAEHYSAHSYSRSEIASLLNEELGKHPEDHEGVAIFQSDDVRLTDELCYKFAVSFCWNTDGPDDSTYFNDSKWDILDDMIGQVL